MRRAQGILMYAALIFLVTVTLLIMWGYIQRRVMGTYQQAGDAFGEGEQKD